MAARPPREPKTPRSCHERALGLLAVRSRSRRELEQRLEQAGFEDVEVADVLERLQRVGLVDDEAFARELAAQAFRGRRSSTRAVRHALSSKGVAPATSAAVIQELGGDEDEEERALALASSRAARLASLPPEKAFTRLVGLLARRGYAPGVARSAARAALRLEHED